MTGPSGTPSRAPAPGDGPDRGAAEFKLRVALEEMVRRRASDLHLKVGRPPMLRIHGDLVQTDSGPIKADDLRKCSEQILNEEQRERFAQDKEMDLAIGIQGLGRFRVNLFQQRGTLGFAFRAIPFEIPSMADLQLPPILHDVALLPRGLILVTGIAGSGKSTTLAAMIRHMNEHRALNIVTIEDPIEFLHRDVRSMVSQREVGEDTHSFHEALRHVLRQDPNVVMLGEIRDRESMETVLEAANTGHLVLSTLHTTDVVQSISRIISFFPPHQQAEVRSLLAEALRAVVSLRLIPRADASGRVPAAEVLTNTSAVADRIRAGDRIHTLLDLVAEGRTQYGMQTFDQSLMDLFRRGWITQEWAMQYATHPAEFALRASGVEAASDLTFEGHGRGNR